MRKVVIIVLLLVLVFLISGCDRVPQIPGIPGQDDKPSVGRGLRLFFADNAPPTDRILIGGESKFLVRVGIENYGEEVSGTLRLWDNIPGGRMEKDFSVDVPAADIRYDDNRDTITSIFPTKYFTETHEVEYDEKDIAPGTKLNLFAELTVDNYHALVETGICLKREEDLDSSCSNNEVVTSSQLGRQTTYLPVAIDRIEKVATPLSDNNYFVNLKITFKNLGGGTIFQPGSEEERFEQVMDAPTVALPVTTEGEIKCSPSKLVFENNAASLNCFLNLAAGETYVTYPLRIGYDFGYKMRIKQGSIPLVKISEIERTLEG